MPIIKTKQAPTYHTTDGQSFTDPGQAIEQQLRVSLEEMMHAKRFTPNPGPAGHWDWTSVVTFMATNHEELRILFKNVVPD